MLPILFLWLVGMWGGEVLILILVGSCFHCLRRLSSQAMTWRHDAPLRNFFSAYEGRLELACVFWTKLPLAVRRSFVLGMAPTWEDALGHDHDVPRIFVAAAYSPFDRYRAMQRTSSTVQYQDSAESMLIG